MKFYQITYDYKNFYNVELRNYERVVANTPERAKELVREARQLGQDVELTCSELYLIEQVLATDGSVILSEEKDD